jgi:hypothetical protein
MAQRIAVGAAVALGASIVLNTAAAALARAASPALRAFLPLAPGRVAVLTGLGVAAGVASLALVRWLAGRGPLAFRLGLAGLGLALPLGLVALGTPRLLPFLVVAGLAVAAGLFAVAPRLRERPLAAFQVLAGTMLVLSFVPDGSLLVGPLAPFLGAFFHPTVPAVLVLALLHTLAAATTVGFLTYSAR